MNKAQQTVADWMRQFGQETPEKPTIPSFEIRKLRARLMLEECLETVEALGFAAASGKKAKEISASYIEAAARITPDLEAIADGCADSHVVTIGTEVACGLRSEENFAEVMRSNFTKLWTAAELEQMPNGSTARAVKSGSMTDRCILVKDAAGKVLKSPSYSPAALKI